MRPSASRLGKLDVDVVGAIARSCSKGRACVAAATAVCAECCTYCAAACAEAACAASSPPSKRVAGAVVATALRLVVTW